MLFSLGNNTVDIDIEKTKQLYLKLPAIWQQCQCTVCRNFEERLKDMCDDKIRYLHMMGIKTAKCQKPWAYEPGAKPSTQKYLIRYPLVCSAVSFEAPGEWQELDKGLFACFDMYEGQINLFLDWELRWGKAIY